MVCQVGYLAKKDSGRRKKRESKFHPLHPTKPPHPPPAGDKGCPFGAMGSLLPGNQV